MTTAFNVPFPGARRRPRPRIVASKRAEVAELRPRAAELRARALDRPPARGLARALCGAGEGPPPGGGEAAQPLRRSDPPRRGTPPRSPGSTRRAAPPLSRYSPISPSSAVRSTHPPRSPSRGRASAPSARTSSSTRCSSGRARDAGADAVLLIVRILDGGRLAELGRHRPRSRARRPHRGARRRRALPAPWTPAPTLVGVNNRRSRLLRHRSRRQPRPRAGGSRGGDAGGGERNPHHRGREPTRGGRGGRGPRGRVPHAAAGHSGRGAGARRPAEAPPHRPVRPPREDLRPRAAAKTPRPPEPPGPPSAGSSSRPEGSAPSPPERAAALLHGVPLRRVGGLRERHGPPAGTGCPGRPDSTSCSSTETRTPPSWRSLRSRRALDHLEGRPAARRRRISPRRPTPSASSRTVSCSTAGPPDARGGTGHRFPWEEVARVRDVLAPGVDLIAAGGPRPRETWPARSPSCGRPWWTSAPAWSSRPESRIPPPWPPSCRPPLTRCLRSRVLRPHDVRSHREAGKPRRRPLRAASAGRFVPETLIAALDELTAVYAAASGELAFRQELDAAWRDYVGRPTPIYPAARLGEAAGGIEVYLKREGPQPHRRAQDQQLAGAGPARPADGKASHHRRDRGGAARRRHRHGVRPLRPRLRGLHGRGGRATAGPQRLPHEATGRRGEDGDGRHPHPEGCHQRGDPRLGDERE